MEISIGSYKMRLEILILIVVVFWILFGHLLCSCCNFSLKEGLEMVANAASPTVEGSFSLKNKQIPSSGAPHYNAVPGGAPLPPTTGGTSASSAAPVKEGFTGANNVAFSPEFAGAKAADYIMNPSTWGRPTLVYSPGTKPDAGVQAIWNRPKQPIPLPKGEMDFFATTPFAPECCPNAYSSSTGCACMTVDQYGYLLERSGNNVPYSVY